MKNTPIPYLQNGETSPNECPDYDTKQSDSEAQVMLVLGAGMQSIPSSPLLPGQLWPGGVAHDSLISMCQIELFDI